MATALVGSDRDISSSVASHLNPVKFANVVSLSPKPTSFRSLLESRIDSNRSEDCNDSGKIQEKPAKQGSPNTEIRSPTNCRDHGDDGTETAEDDEVFRKLQTDYERSKEERKKEQDEAALERHRLDEILRLCCEYDTQVQRQDRETEVRQRPSVDEKRDSRNSWGSGTKIKTNGSLTSLVTHIKRCDDVAHLESCVTVSGTEFDARRRSQETETNSERSEIAKKSNEKQEFLGNFPPNQTDRSNSRCRALVTSPSPNQDCFRNELKSSLTPHYVTDMSSRGDSVLADDSLQQRCGMSTGEAARGPHFGSHSDLLPRKFNGLGLDRLSQENRHKRSTEDAKERIKVLQLRIMDVKNLEEKTINETQSDLELLQWEYNALMEQLRREKDRIAVINQQQMELLLEAAKERDEAEKQIESERFRLKELEKHLEETRKRCLTLGTEPIGDVTLEESALGDLVVKETEEVEQQRRFFDDLEFHLLELETRREEEREPQQRKLSAELEQLKRSCSLIEETLQQLSEQKLCLIRQLKSDVVDLEKERILLIEDFRKEKKKLYCLLQETSPRSNNLPERNPMSVKDIDNCKDMKATRESSSSAHDEELFPTTPSSTASVIQRLQELQKHTTHDVSGVSSARDFRLDSDNLDHDHSLVSPDSATSFDQMKSWFSEGVVQRQDNTSNSSNSNNRPRFLSGSDEDGSVLSSDDRFDEQSFGTNGSEVLLDSFQQNDLSNGDSCSVGRYCIRSARSATEVSTFSFTVSRDWTNEDSISQNSKSQETTKVVMRQSHRVQARPMTRYLPVRGSCDLDLRQFVESSGHRLDGGIQVQVTSTVCRGFLVKLGRRFRLWHRRWFVFDRSRRSITYYSDQTEKRVRGCILFGSIEDVFVDHLRKVRSPSPKLTFCLKTTAKTLFLLAPTPEAMRIWIDVLFTGAEGYQEFS